MAWLAAAASLLALAAASVTSPPGWKVELHNHIDGSLSPITLWDIAHARGMQTKFPADVKCAEDLRKYISVSGGHTLQHFLATFDFFMPFLQDDVQAVEMLAKAFVLQQAASRVLYTEGRFAPQLLNGTNTTVDDIVSAVLRGIDVGVTQAGVEGMRVNLILCCMRGLPAHRCNDVVRLATKYRNTSITTARVVGIDMAEGGGPATGPFADWLPAFESAHAQQVHATVHAGESCVAPESCPDNCETALRMRVTRIGHGYNCGEQAWAALRSAGAVSYTHLRAHETVLDLVCRLLLEKKKKIARSKKRRVTSQMEKK
eukprot:TRINITY_DN14486_c0_g1_i1.p1 TRINITY_DN14486_c0_g1~~TRINITY_DN14486_c0_g1_i1.p1  ORF type:complete len:316 (+),score=44.50 TRINITY_DN14486_c0_g1_i1:160-1107(+)